MSERIKFRFPTPDPDGVEGDIALSIFSAECIHGRPRTRLDIGYFLATDGRRAVVDVRGPAGEMALRVLLGLLGARFGEAGFEVQHAQASAGGDA